MFWFFGHEAYGILAPWPGIEPEPPAFEGEILTTGQPGKTRDNIFVLVVFVLLLFFILPHQPPNAENGDWSIWTVFFSSLYPQCCEPMASAQRMCVELGTLFSGTGHSCDLFHIMQRTLSNVILLDSSTWSLSHVWPWAGTPSHRKRGELKHSICCRLCYVFLAALLWFGRVVLVFNFLCS